MTATRFIGPSGPVPALCAAVVMAAAAGGCYRTQLLPPTTLRVADETGRPPPGLYGSVDLASLEEHVWDERIEFDDAGRAELPEHHVDRTFVWRVFAVLASAWPHQGAPAAPVADVSIAMPPGYEVDPGASGLVEADGKSSYILGAWTHPDGSSVYVSKPRPPSPWGVRKFPNGALTIRLKDPSRRSRAMYLFVLRHGPGGPAIPGTNGSPAATGPSAAAGTTRPATSVDD